MTEEIKEMNLSEMLFNRDERLLNYITNLQKEKEDLQRKYLIINENNQNMQEEMVRTWKKCDDYKQRNEKAIEYIKTLKNYRFEFTFDSVDRHEIVGCEKNFVKDLLNILQSGDE